VLRQFNLPWRAAAVLLRIVPGFLRDTVYNAVARRRYRFFGRFDTCMLPRDLDHSRFLDG
jgi:predicted DCC family thiol-disulfide oxidoreductase YuxK